MKHKICVSYETRPMPHERHSADQIRALFQSAGCSLCAERARRLAEAIASYGDLQATLEGLAQDDAFAVLTDALSYRALLAERDDPSRLIARLLREACDLDARAEPAWSDAAEIHGRAAFRERQGEHELARQFEHRARAAERFAAALEEQAFLKRLQAAQVSADRTLGAALRDLAA
jgi:hypothetical protein